MRDPASRISERPLNNTNHLLIALLLSTSACGGVDFEPLVAHRTWATDDKTEVFNAAIRVLHNQDYLIASSDTSAGLISTDWKQFASDDWKTRSRINLWLMKEADGYLAVDCKPESARAGSV